MKNWSRARVKFNLTSWWSVWGRNCLKKILVIYHIIILWNWKEWKSHRNDCYKMEQLQKNVIIPLRVMSLSIMWKFKRRRKRMKKEKCFFLILQFLLIQRKWQQKRELFLTHHLHRMISVLITSYIKGQNYKEIWWM